MLRIILFFVAAAAPGAIAAAAPASSQPSTVPSITRAPQWPLKDRRTLFTDEAIARARENVASYASATAVADSWIKLADEWVTWDDAELAGLIASASVPRDWGVSASSRCPECGNVIGDPNNKPGWIVDPKKPFKVTCPICNNVFPTNDFETYYRSGFKTKIGWDTKYVDDGWGWTDPKTGEKQWWVAFANHWTVHGKLMNVMHALGRAYLLTGDQRYAHKALVLLHRYAEVYPEMDYESQSRYGTMMRAMGRSYSGKIAYNTWETDLVTALAEAYDASWDAIDGDEQLQKQTGKSSKQIRAFIEANLLEDAIDAYFAGKILGNFGMHQSTLAHLAIVRQYGHQDKWFDLLMNESSPNYQHLGLRFALYNVIFRDGIPFETSSHYNSIWVRKITEYASLLDRAGRKPFEIPKLRRLYDGVLAQVVARAHNPSVGDGGSIWGGIFPQDPASFQTAYRQYGDPRYLRFLLAMYGPPTDGGFNNFEALLHPPIDVPQALATGPISHPALPPRLLDGYGMGILNNRQDSIAAALYYGVISSHGHFDRLHFELFAHGHPMMPDLGYPDAMNEFVPGIHTWSKNTIAHNTVTVDGSRQSGNVPGTVELFADGDFARVMDISAAGTYPQCDQYRRAMIMVDCGENQSYFVDIFTVSGGKQHDYSLHGPPGAFETIGGQWSDTQQRGTLAGEEVAVGQIYDDSKLGAAGYKGGYSSYGGSGFQHFYNVRRHRGVAGGGETVAQWSHAKDPAAKLRIRVLPQPEQQLILANARVSPVKHPEVLTYLISRRQGQDLASRFVSVIEPFKGDPLIKAVRPIQLSGDSGTAIEIMRSDGGSDLIIYDLTGTENTAQDGAIVTNARVAVVRRDASGQLSRRYFAGGSFLTVDGNRIDRGRRTGSVVSVDAARSQIRVKPENAQATPEDFIGRVVHFQNDLRRTAHPIVSARREGEEIILTASDDLLVGRARVEGVDDGAVATRTALPLAPIYRGVTLAGEAFEPLARVTEVGKGKISLATPIRESDRPAAGDDVWLVNVGPGDQFELPAVGDESRE
ncbi:MAG TPA: heparinase II/III family protein [Tepidisphaeraceae bacterium]|nr:heparinase II/III family protein [Tepidisphaeraceae bacterium]